MEFNEDTRVKLPATIHFLKLGYNYQTVRSSEINRDNNIFEDRFHKAIEKINNRKFTKDEIGELISDISRKIKNKDLGKEFYNRLISTDYPIKLIDLENIDNNDFAVVNELNFRSNTNSNYDSFRPDITILVNGMPLAFLEVKVKNNKNGIQAEFIRMWEDRLKVDEYRKFFNMLQIVSFTNNMDYEEFNDAEASMLKQGSFYTTPNGKDNTTFSAFREDEPNYHANYHFEEINNDKIKEVLIDNRIETSHINSDWFQSNLSDTTPCNRFITSIFDKERFLYFIKYGMMYLSQIKEIKNETLNKVEQFPINQKHIMRYPQFFATRAIIKRFKQTNKNGIIWHTQGSGKTALSAFATKVIKDYWSKKKINARFFFIVDRLDLMRQASAEFTNRGFNVVNVDSKEAFAKELNEPIDRNNNGIGTICVVNIHKFMDSSKMPEAKNDYNIRTQRIFFIDEAHRSYTMHGEFYKNLMTCDRSGIYIAMTGTPLLTKRERSNLKFGDYIHKYFYDKSIADGYTLRIKKEQIKTEARTTIIRNLNIEIEKLESRAIYESEDYVKSVSQYIETDFIDFRLICRNDSTIGGMIVCRSNDQAKKIHEWFKKNSKLTTGLVLSDTDNPLQDNINKNNQKTFKESNYPDILVVHYMLTTGYDVKRLKKMYLLRGPKAQNLLQTISRVNRPYRSPNGQEYQYGYIVDFIDIEKEYNNTIDAYRKEIEEEYDFEEEGTSLSGLIIDKTDIKKRYDILKSDLEKFVNNYNLETFVDKINNFDKDTLQKIKKILVNIKNCSIEFKLSQADEYSKLINDHEINVLIKEVQRKINFLNLRSDPIDTIQLIDNKEVVQIIYDFLLKNITVLDLGKFDKENKMELIKQKFMKMQKEIKENKNTRDVKFMNLNALIKKLFDKLAVEELTYEEVEDKLDAIYNSSKKINDENKEISKDFGNSFAFVTTMNVVLAETKLDRSILKNFLLMVYDELKGNISDEILIKQGKNGFIDSTKSKITTKLIKKNLYKQIKDNYDYILNELYFNLLNYKETL